MSLSRNAKRRLALYGSAAVLITIFLGVPRLVQRMAPKVKVRLFDTKKAMAHEAAKLLVEYVRIDTSGGKVRPAADLLARVLACEGIPYEMLGDDPDRPVLYSRLAGSARGDGLALLHHMDVVPPGDLSAWSRPPFTAELGEGLAYAFLYGRGTLDMKGQGVANLYAFLELHRSGITPLRDIVFIAEPAEESYRPDLGVGWILDHRPELLEGVTDFFNEGGVNEVIATDIERWGINLFEKGAVSLELTAPAREPLLELRKTLDAENPNLPYSLIEPARDFMKFLAPSRADYFGRMMAEPEKAFASDYFRRVAPEPYLAVIKDMVYTQDPKPLPQGGFLMPVVYTLLPGSRGPAYRDHVVSLAKEKGVNVAVRLMTSDAGYTKREGRAWQALVDCLGLDGERAPLGVYLLTGQYTHSSYLRSRGFRAFGFSPFNVHFNDAVRIHAPNERINVELFVEGVERMKRIVREYATRP